MHEGKLVASAEIIAAHMRTYQIPTDIAPIMATVSAYRIGRGYPMRGRVAGSSFYTEETEVTETTENRIDTNSNFLCDLRAL